MDTLLQDIRFGWRLLRRTPGFTVAATLALALGVGATTAIFTVLDRVVLRPLPYPDPGRLVMVWDTNGAKGLSHERLSPVTFLDYRTLGHVFVDGAGWWYPQVNLAETGKDPLRVNAIEASGNFFAVIGVQPILGAGFPAETFYARERIAVISHRLWRERFQGDPSIVGKIVKLSDAPYVVAGVMPIGFNFPNGTDVWQRLQWDFAQHSRAAHSDELDRAVVLGADLARAKGDPKLSKEVKKFERQGSQWVILDTTSAPFTDVRVRQALSLATDGKQLNEGVLKDAYYNAVSIVAPGIPGQKRENALGFDARAMNRSHDPTAPA